MSKLSALLPFALCLLPLLVSLSACRQDMHDAPRYDPFEASTVFAKGSSAQPLVAGTVPRGFLKEDQHLYTGGVNGEFQNTFPFPITREDLDRGEEQFNAYCSPCHGRTGDGNGMVIQRGFPRQPPSLHIDRLRSQMPLGYLFNVMTVGFATMPDYAGQIAVEDRWRIVAYIRALQLSQNATAADIPAEEMRKLEAPPAAPGRQGGGH